MNIDQYRSGLLPIIDKKVMDSEIQLNKSIISDVLIPITIVLKDTITKQKIQSEHLKKLEGVYTRLMPGKSLFDSITEKTQQVNELLVFIDKEANKYFPRKLATNTMTYKHVAIIRTMEAISEWIEFTQHFIFYALSAENAKTSNQRLDLLINKATIKEVETRFINYCNITRDIIKPTKEFEKSLANTPELIIQKTDESVASVVSGNLNPTRAGFISTKASNVILRVLGSWDEYQARRYQIAKEMLKAYEVQLLHLEQLRSNSNETNTAIEQRIEELTALIEEQKHKLIKIRRKYDLDEEI